MVERKLYKTKLCVLYQRGNCRRQSCSFAHGDAELRRFSSGSASFNGRRDNRASDLREKLGRKRSPLRKYQHGRDARGRNSTRGDSPSRSIGRRSDRKRRKKEQSGGQSVFSGDLKESDEMEDQFKDKRQSSSDPKDILHEQLRQVQLEINMLDDHKRKLEIYLEENAQEADCLSSKIQDLEMQLAKEKEECKRITSKMKKFIKAHSRCTRLEDELRRSNAQLHKLGEQLGSDAVRSGANEEDSSINILSDGDTAGIHVLSPGNDLQKNSSSKRWPPILLDTSEAVNQGQGI